ncbi:uncharacterized protein UTRI_01128_B [Ustilago trichophora]|uniref:Uncharacterized protein n=1 Tax=Ustilago trichophora TaxID=86804 RepID=A0A5C3DT66_9BASI|nr:uncharacterized protein UTRI_01128_B [Ustilago trichophora]
MRLQEHQTLEWISFAWLILAFALFCPSFGFPAPPTGVSERLGKGLADIAEAIHEDGARDRVESISRSTVQSRNEAGASSSHSQPQAQAFMDTGASASGSTSGVTHVFVPHYSAYIPIQYSPVPVTFLHPATQRALHPSTNMLVHYEGQPHLLFAHQPTSVPIAARPVQAVPAAYSQEARLATPSQPQGSDPPFNLRAPQHSARGQSFAATTSGTHTQRDNSQTGGSANAAGVVQGKPTLAEILPRHSQKKMKLSQRLWTSRMERERSRKGITEQSQMSGTDPLVRQTAVDNVESLSDSKFRLFEEEDPQVNTFISSLRRTKQPEQDSGVAETSRPVRPYSQNAQKPSLLASRTFFHRKQAVQLLLKTSEGQRSLFVTYVVRPSWMPPSPTQGYIGVWEIAPSLDPEALGLYLRGFFPFLPLDFEALENLPQATGMKYWFWKDRTKDAASLPTFNLYIAKVDPVMVTEPQELHHLQDIPEIQALEQSGQMQAVHLLSRTHMGRHNYAYMESPETVDLINQWKIAAGLVPTSFRPIPLTQEQIENISANMAPTYRNWRDVKVLANQNGELYMLSWIKKIPWLKQHRGAAVVVWKIGPVIDERRLLIAKGFYGLKKGEWERLTPENVPGLRYSRFQRGMAELP